MANYVLLERIELNASAASVTFSNIPQTGYTDLKIVSSYRTNRAQIFDQLRLTFNGSSTAVYSFRGLTGDGALATSESSASVASIKVAPGGGNSATSNTFTNDEIYIPNYLSSNNKSLSSEGVGENNATTAYASMFAGLWANTAAINSVTLTPEGAGTFLQYSTFSLYGLAAVGTTPAIAPKASGGNRIDYDGTYWIHTFLTSGTFTPQIALTCDYLVVAGGGGGGNGGGGGGGAGGFRTATGFAVAASALAITVGAGGAGSPAGAPGGRLATQGNDSIFSSITSVGGGAGSGSGGGGTGGSGGGAQVSVSNAAGTSGQGNQGGAGNASAPNYGSGGGGGASAAGGNGTSTTAGNGGAGTASSYSGSSVTYAGGGGGSTYQGGTRGTGGAGGGGNGGAVSTNNSGDAGTVNTGGGGGGAAYQSSYAGGGGLGGSGIVIIRYLA